MQIEPATCPTCGTAFDPLRSRAVTVVDGRVRAFCSTTCRDRGPQPQSPPPAAEPPPKSRPPGVWRRLGPEQRLLVVAAGVSLAAFALVLVLGRHHAAAQPPAIERVVTPLVEAAPPPLPAAPLADVWIQPLAGGQRRVIPHDRRLFAKAREGITADQCRGGRCAVDIEAEADAVVMAVHDGVIESVERNLQTASQRGLEGRFLRINHNGGTVVSSYMQLDGIRADLRPGIPVKVGEPIGTVGRFTGSSPHLRFAVSFRETSDSPEMFVDPQPMLILWPLRARASSTLQGMERPSAEFR